MKRIAAAVAVLGVVIAVLLARRCGSSTEVRAPEVHGATAVPGGRGLAATAAAGRTGGLPGGFADASGPARRIAGRVMFADKPFAGATVTLSAWGGLIIPADNERTSAADGTFDFGPRAAAAFEVVASAPDKAAAIAHVQLANPNAKPAPDRLELVLAACATRISGTVRDAAGGPIVRAQVRREGVAGVETDDQGAYELCVPSGEHVIEYGADDYGSVLLTIAADLHTRRDVVLVPEAVVQGIVIDEGGTPIAGAYVSVVSMTWGPERPAPRSAISDDDGRFRITRVMTGRVRVWGFAEDLSTADATEVVATVGTSPDVTLTLYRRASVSGKVVRAGQPVAGTEVVAARRSPAGRSAVGYSQADGSFVLSRVPPGDFVIMTNQYRVVAPAELHVETKAITGVIVEVEAMASIKGRVTRHGKPVEGTRVCCVPQPTSREVFSNADGDYAFEGVEAGSYQMFAQDDRVGAFTYEKDPVVVAAGEAKRVDFELSYAATITGTVVDDHGAPVPAVIVRFQNPTNEDSCRAIADERGRYRCPAMTGGAKYTAQVIARSGADGPMSTPADKPYPVIDVKDGESLVEDVTITVIHRRGVIRGRVVDTSGAPVVDAQVRANTEDRFPSWSPLPSTVTDPDGGFTLRELGEASYTLQARSPDGGTGTASAVPINRAPITIVVTRPGAIEGALVGYPASPPIYAVPTAPFSEQTMGEVTGATYRIGGLKPGRYVVTAQTTFEGDIREVEVRSGETVRLDFTAKGRATIDATVRDYATKAPVAGIQCHVVMSANGVQGLTNWDLATAPRSDATGRIHFDPAPAGNVIIACMTADGRRSAPSAELAVAVGTTATVQLWSVAKRTEAWPYAGLNFDWRAVPPRIALVEPKGPAGAVGLAAGDLVVAVDDNPVDGLDANGVMYLILDHAVGTKVPIAVQRGTQRLRVELELRAQP